ncbi:hypothetical protein ACFL6U_30960, partial [Planctomycetota bacterium]
IKSNNSCFGILAGWTPNNEIGVFQRSKKHIAIYSVLASGGKAVQVTPEESWPYYPRWSPDGKHIFFRRVKQDHVIMVYVPAKGGNPVEVPVQSVRKLMSKVPGGGHNISPDGKKIVISAYQEPVDPKEGPDVWVINLDGSNPLRLTHDGLVEGYPCWSPDGQWIAFKDRHAKQEGEGYEAIYIVAATGGEIKQVTAETDIVGNGAIAFSPDGTNITFFSDGKIKNIPLEGGQQKVLVGNVKSGRHSHMAYSPDGLKIAYNIDGKIWIRRIDDGGTEKLKTGLSQSVQISEFSWSPNGEKIAFVASSGGELGFYLVENFLPLDKLAQNDEAAEAAPKTTTVQKVWLGDAQIGWGNVSPNGKFLTYADDSLNLALRELSTGKTSPLTKDAAEDPLLQFNMGSVVSPNNKQVAYAWYKNNHEIRLLDIDNPQPKTIYANKDEDVYPCAWSPDGKIIYAKSYLNNTGQCQILAITVSNGNVQVLKTFEGFYWLQLSVSPDNRFIAYHYPNVKNGEISDTDIHMISTDGKNETKLFEHPANDQILGWFPDKNQLLFKSDRSGSWDAWTVEVVHGKVAGDPQKVLTEIGENACQMGFTQNGTFYYSLMSRKYDGFITPFDQTKGELISESVKPLLGSVRTAKWSPNGKSLAIIKELWIQDKRPLYVRDTETGNERMLSDSFIIRRLKWLQDNKTLLIVGNDERRESEENYSGGMYTINIQTSEITEVLALSDYRGRDWEIASMAFQMLAKGNTGQKNIYFLKNGQLICRELASGEEKILLKDPCLNSNNYTLGPLPGEKNLLYCNEDQIYIIPVSGGKQIPIMKRTTVNSGPSVPNSAVWSTDGNYIFYTQNIDGGSVLWQITSDGKNPKEVYHSKVPICSLSIHPNGKKIAMTTLDQGAEIWKVENLLPKEVASDNN